MDFLMLTWPSGDYCMQPEMRDMTAAAKLHPAHVHVPALYAAAPEVIKTGVYTDKVCFPVFRKWILCRILMRVQYLSSLPVQ